MMQIKLSALVFVGLLLIGEGFSQCYLDIDCNGTTISATSKKDCCVGTNDGLAYFENGDCSVCIVHGFQRAKYNITEDNEDAVIVVFERNVKSSTNMPLPLRGTITVTAGGTADVADFQQVPNVTLVDDKAEISIETRNDRIALEYDDQIILTYTSSRSGFIAVVERDGEFIRDRAIFCIIDNDRLEINFKESDIPITEGLALPQIVVNFRQVQNSFTLIVMPETIASAEDQIVNLNDFIGSDSINDDFRATIDDFTSGSKIFTISAGTVSFNIPPFFNVTDDNINEIEQSFAVVAKIGPDVPENSSCFQTQEGVTDCVGRYGATRIRITDNDPMIIGFEIRNQTVSESDVPPGFDTLDIMISVRTQRKSERVQQMDFQFISSSSTAIVVETIGESAYDAVFLDNVQLLPPGEVNIPPIITSVGNDFLPEDQECYTIEITSDDIAGVRDLFSCNDSLGYFCEHTICIEDDDDPFVVELVDTMYTVLENESSVEVCAILSEPQTDILDEEIVVYVINFPSTYIPLGAVIATPDTPDLRDNYLMVDRTDYAEQIRDVNLIDDAPIKEEMRVVCYNQSIYDDVRLEPDEYAGLTLGVARSRVMILVRDLYDTAAILIVDDDVAVVGLEETFYVVPEGDMVEVCAIVSSPSVFCPIEFPFSVNLSTADGSAVSPMDYGALSIILTFDTCETRKCATILIMDDAIPEGTESFTVTLVGTPGLDDRITLDPVDGEIQISDRDEAVVGLERTLYQVSEGVGYVIVCAVVIRPDENTDCPIGFAFEVELSTINGSAVQIMDYVSLDTTLQFAECDRMSCVNITINEDETLENIESFFVTLKRNGLDSRITLNPTRAEIEISDDDGPGVVGLEQTFYQTSEEVGTVEVCAVVYSPNGNLACPIDFAFSVELQTRDGDAVSTMDYGSNTTTLPFGRCDTRSCVNVSITDDEVLEDTESFFVSLLRKGLDSTITLDPTQGEIEIIDNDDAVIGLERTLYSIQEGSAPAVEVCIVVYRPTGICPIPFPFSVMFSTSDLTAVVDNDYLDADTIQIFGACATRRCIVVPIVDDSIGELDELVSISLGDPSDSRITASPRQGLINITDTIIETEFVNDTVTGDPLMTVPVGFPDTSTLCYEVHGESDKFFNLISDNCVSVNAHYARSGINNPNITLNVIDAVGIRAVSNNGSCVNIGVDLEGCTASINGVERSGMYRENGIVVRKYSSRVRITVPNCDDTDLVMWVFCTSGRTEDPFTWKYFSFNFLRFVVMRGINLREESHGLLGQFWNIEIEVEEHADTFNGASRSDDYTVTVHPNDLNKRRSFVALVSSVTWEFERKPCLYVGNSQAGPLGEDVTPNESVIEGTYKDYMVDSMFSPNFKFAHIDQDNCMAK